MNEINLKVPICTQRNLDFVAGRFGHPSVAKDFWVGSRQAQPTRDRSQDDLVDAQTLGAFGGTLLKFTKTFRPNLGKNIAKDEDFDFLGARMADVGDGVPRILLTHAFTVGMGGGGGGKGGGETTIVDNPKERSRTYREIIEQGSPKSSEIKQTIFL